MKRIAQADKDRFLPKWWRSSVFRELGLIALAGIMVFILVSYFDIFEKYRQWVRSRGLETWEADDIVFLLVFLAFAFSIFSYRRSSELRDEIIARRKAERLKDEFLSMVSHELRTPLTPIREGISQVVDGLHGPTTPRQEEYLKIALSDVDRLSRIIGDLFDISKIESGHFKIAKEHIDMVSMARHVQQEFEPQARAKGLELKAILPGDTVEVYADPGRMMQVWSNLIANALKFTAAGFVELGVTGSDGRVTCWVKDSGPGIPAEELPKVFTKFFQGRRTAGPGTRGTGLGLPIAKGIVESHGGMIWAESRPSEGSTFTFVLPKATA
jgi:signal transduction histidine kinase